MHLSLGEGASQDDSTASHGGLSRRYSCRRICQQLGQYIYLMLYFARQYQSQVDYLLSLSFIALCPAHYRILLQNDYP